MRFVCENGGFWLYCDTKEILDIVEDVAVGEKLDTLLLACNWGSDDIYNRDTESVKAEAHALILTAKTQKDNLLSVSNKLYESTYDMKLDAINIGKVVLLGSGRGFHFTTKKFDEFDVTVNTCSFQFPSSNLRDWKYWDRWSYNMFTWDGGLFNFRGQAMFRTLGDWEEVFEKFVNNK